MKPSDALIEYMARCVSYPDARILNGKEQEILLQVLKEFKASLKKPVLIGSPRA